MIEKPLWTPEQEEILRQKVSEGWSARQIGELIGKSRNGVIGKVHRLKLQLFGSERGKRLKAGYKERTKITQKPSEPKLRIKPVPKQFNVVSTVRPANPVTPLPSPEIKPYVRSASFSPILAPPRGYCQWPIPNWCGEPTEGTQISYCTKHQKKSKQNN